MNKNNDNRHHVKAILASLLVMVSVCFTLGINQSFAQNANTTATSTAEVGTGQSAIEYVKSKIEVLKKQLDDLNSELSRLEREQLNNDKVIDTNNFCHTFTTNLSIGNKGKDIPALHTLLKLEGFEVPNEQGIFSEKTAASVKAFQEKYTRDVLSTFNLTKGTGYVGATTRAKMNSLYGCTDPEIVNKITPSILPDAAVGTFYSARLINQHSTSSPMLWSVTSGTMPEGLFLARGGMCIDFVPPQAGTCLRNNESLLYGTPVKDGIYRFAIRASSTQVVAETRYEIKVSGAPSVGTIEVVTPNGDERWILNTTKTIRWESNVNGSSKEKVQISLAPYYPPCRTEICPLSPVQAPYVIIPSTTNDGAHDWVVGKLNYGDTVSKIFPPAQFTIQVCTVDGNVCDSSNSPFLIIDVPSSSNKSPSINKITAPTTLAIDEVGTWDINATDPEGSALTYSINWGDQTPVAIPLGTNASTVVAQKSSFTHSYSNPGTYVVEVTVSDSIGKTAKATATVVVSDPNKPTIPVQTSTTTSLIQGGSI
jgi:hypothetical protein